VSGIGWLGNLNAGPGNVNMPPGGFKASSKFQNTLGVDVTVTTLHGLWDVAAGPLHIKAFAYDDVAGVPTNLLAVTNELTAIPGAGISADFTFVTPWVWPAGAYRWLGVISPEGASSNRQNTNGGTDPSATINYNTDPYTASLPSNPYGTPSTVSPFEYRFWVECFDAQQRFGRIQSRDSRGNSPQGVYWHYNPHFDLFTFTESVNVTVNAISAFITQASVSATVYCAIYNNDGGGGSPVDGATLVAATTPLVGILANVWTVFSFASPPTLTPGTYWLAIISDTDLNTNVSPAGHLVAPSIAGGSSGNVPFPATIPVGYGSVNDQSPLGISIYASYDLIAGAFDPATALVAQPQAFLPARHWTRVPY
jgi:hypothetical protein